MPSDCDPVLRHHVETLRSAGGEIDVSSIADAVEGAVMSGESTLTDFRKRRLGSARSAVEIACLKKSVAVYRKLAAIGSDSTARAEFTEKAAIAEAQTVAKKKAHRRLYRKSRSQT